MSYAIYGESDTYVHLVSAETREGVIGLFAADVMSVGVNMKDVYNIYAVQDNREDKELEDFIMNIIKGAQQEV